MSNPIRIAPTDGRTNQSAYAPRRFARWNARTVWLQVHLWIGLAAGLVAALTGLSGSLLVFAGPMIRAEKGAIVAPDPATLAKGDHWAPLETWIANARARYPDLHEIEYVVAPDAAPVPSTVPLLVGHVHTAGPDGAEAYEGHVVVGMDPVRGEPLGTFLFEDTWTGKIMTFHTGLLAGTIGSHVVVWSSLLALLLSLGTGLYLWWPRQTGWVWALTFKRNARGRRRLLDLHNVATVWLLLPLAIVLLSGLYIVRSGWFDPAIRVVSELREPGPAVLASKQDVDCGGVSIDAALALALRDNPGWRLRILEIPEAVDAPYYVGLIRPDGDPKVMATELWIGRSCPTILFARRGEELTAGETVKSWVNRIHADLGLGLLGQTLVFLTGLLLPLLWVTGVLLWLSRRSRPGRKVRHAADERPVAASRVAE